MQVVGQILCARVAAGRVLVQALQANGFQVARHPRVDPRRRRRFLGDHPALGLDRGRPVERRAPGESLVQDRAQRVDVRRRADFCHFAQGLLGRHVTGRAQPSPGVRQFRSGADEPGQAEVRDHRRAPRVRAVDRRSGEENVGRFQVAVNDTALVRELNGDGERGDQFRGPARVRQRTGELLREGSALDQFHREVRPPLVLADLVDRHDVRVPQRRRGLDLALESCPLLRAGVAAREEHLQCDRAVRFELSGSEDDTHAAAPENGLDLVTRDERQCPRSLRRVDSGVRTRSREQFVELARDAPDPRPPRPDLREQIRIARAHLFRRAVPVEKLLKEQLNTTFVRHVLLRACQSSGAGEKSGKRSANRSRPRLRRRDTVLTDTPNRSATSA